MAGLLSSRSRSMPRRHPAGASAAETGGAIGSPALLAAIAVSIVAAGVPIAFIVLPGLRGLIGPPRIGNLLLGLLLLIPAAAGLAVAVSGLGQLSRSGVAASRDLEQAVLRILVAALLFGHAVAMAIVWGDRAAVSPALLTAMAGLVAGWIVLVPTMVWPAASPWLRRCATLFDAALISAFLHFGGRDAAGWYPLYLLLTMYAGFRFGLGALVGSAALGLGGFAAVCATTEFWQHEPALTAECAIALFLLPLLVKGPIRAVADARVSAVAADHAKTRFIVALADALRAPLMAMSNPSHAESAAPGHAKLPPRVSDILDLAAIEAGTYAPRAEPFDLHALVNDALAAAREMAASRGIALRARFDPHLPYRFRDWRQSLDRILGNLVTHVIETAEPGTVQVRLAALGGDGAQVRVALMVEGSAETPAVIAAAMTDPFATERGGDGQGLVGLALVKRTVDAMGGEFRVEMNPVGYARLTVELTLSVDMAAVETALESSGCPVLIVTGDSLFAGNVCEYLGGWDAPVSWIGEAEAAVNYIAWLDPATRAVLLVDARGKPLSAIGFVGRALAMNGTPPFVLFVGEPSQMATLGELESGEIDTFLAAPLSPHLLINALHALPLRQDAAATSAPRAEPPAEAQSTMNNPTPFANRVTPIAAHPRFAAELTPAVDPRRIEALRELGGQEGFLGDVIETFRADAQQIMRRLTRAAAIADVAAFAQALRALGQVAGHVGGAPLCQLTISLRGLGPAELRDQGSVHLQRLEAEIHRLATALLHYLGQVEVQRP